MTTTDIDAIRKHIQLAEDWAEYGHVGDPNWHVARTLIKQVPALLDELAQTRIDRDERLTLKESSDLAKMVDAAREELAKTRAELDNAQAMIEGYGELLKGQEDRAERNLRSSVESSNERDAARAQTADATILLIEAAQHGGLPTVLRQRINGFLAEANPATAAEPADEPKATNQTCGYAFVGNVGEFTCDLYAPHPGKKHWNSLAEFAWTDEPSPERAA